MDFTDALVVGITGLSQSHVPTPVTCTETQEATCAVPEGDVQVMDRWQTTQKVTVQVMDSNSGPKATTWHL